MVHCCLEVVGAAEVEHLRLVLVVLVLLTTEVRAVVVTLGLGPCLVLVEGRLAPLVVTVEEV